jgi:hypothetical protein
MRTRIDTSAAGKLANAYASMFNGPNHGVLRDAARMIETLKQAGMIVVLALLSEGLFVLGGALGHREAVTTKPAATAGFAAGAILCLSALMLLYSLGRRDEK